MNPSLRMSSAKPFSCIDAPALLVHDVEPAQPLGFVGAGPKARIARPQPAHIACAPPRFDRGRDRLPQLGREFDVLTIELVAEKSAALARHRTQQLVEGVGEQPDSILHQLRGYALDRNVRSSKHRHLFLGQVNIGLECRAHFAVTGGTPPSSQAAPC